MSCVNISKAWCAVWKFGLLWCCVDTFDGLARMPLVDHIHKLQQQSDHRNVHVQFILTRIERNLKLICSCCGDLTEELYYLYRGSHNLAQSGFKVGFLDKLEMIGFHRAWNKPPRNEPVHKLPFSDNVHMAMF